MHNIYHQAPSILPIHVNVVLLLTFCVLSLFSQVPISSIRAQEGGIAPGETGATNPKPRISVVTAVVPDLQPPNTPILINPENNSTVTTSRPTFVWEVTAGDLSLQDFDLYLDGSILFSGIPVYAVDTNLYTLTYDAATHRYSLIPKTNLADGVHTWKVVARDTNNNTSSSVTWTFTIDTTAPHLIVTAVGSTATSISSQDLSSVPATPIAVAETSPLLQGTGEAHASVQLTLSFTNGLPEQVFTFIIASDGTWQLPLLNLPINIVMYLDFQITDAVGNMSFLSDVPFIIIPGTPSTIPGSTTPLPTSEPGGEQPLPPIVPMPPIIELPNIFEPLPLPFPFELFTRGFLEKITPVTDRILLDNFIVLLMIISILLSRLILTLWPLKAFNSFATIRTAFRMLFFIPFARETKRGLVFDHETGMPVPYAPLFFVRHYETHTKQERIIFTDKHGFFYYLPDEGMYSCTVEQPYCLFPSTFIREENLSLYDLYKGEVFQLDKQTYPALFIPINRFKDVVLSKRERVLLSLQLVDRPSNLLFISIAVVLTLLFPTIINCITTIIYLVCLCIFYLDKRHNCITSTIYDDSGNPLPYTILKINLPQTNDSIDFDLSSREGLCTVNISVSEYAVDAYKLRWQLASAELPVIVMKPTTTITASH